MENKENVALPFSITDIREKEVSVTAFRHRPRMVYEYIDTLGNVVVFTKRGKRDCAIMSIETYALMSGRYEETLTEINALCKEHWEKGKKNGRKKGSQSALCSDND